MKVLVTGGTGFVGRHLVKALVENGATVRMLIRSTSDIDEFKKKDIQAAYGDITDKGSLHGIAEDVEVVYHLAAQTGKWGISDNQFYSINLLGTQNLLEASVRSGVKQFVFCSTPGVQGKGHPQAPEALAYNPPYIYEVTKCQAEKLVLDFKENRKLAVTVIRPDFVYGPGDTRRLALYEAIKKKRFLIIGNGKSVLHPTYIDDLTQAFDLVTNNPIAFGQIYNIAGPSPVTVQEYVETIAQNLNGTVPRLKVPKPLAVLAACTFEALSKVTGKEPLISRSRIEFLTVSHGSDISKAQVQLGYHPRFDLQEGMRRTISWYYNHRLL